MSHVALSCATIR